MKIDELIETVESGSGITSSDNFDVIPVKYPKLERSLNSKRRGRKKHKRRKTIEIGPDMYFSGE